MPVPQLLVDQDQITQFDDVAHAFFRTVFHKDADEVLITDLSELSDFCFLGPLPEGTLDTARPYAELVAAWDRWAIAAVERAYGITLPSTRVYLVALFHQIEQHSAAPVLH
jgi:hypothetical protein